MMRLSTRVAMTLVAVLAVTAVAANADARPHGGGSHSSGGRLPPPSRPSSPSHGGGWHGGGGGGGHWSGGGGYYHPGWRGSVFVGGYWGPRYYYGPGYGPTYYGDAGYSAGYYAPAGPGYYQGSGGYVAAPSRPRPPSFALTGTAGGVKREADEASGGELALAARFRLSGGLWLGAELAQVDFSTPDDPNDRSGRIGAFLMYEFSPRDRWSPFVVGEVGQGAYDHRRNGSTETYDFGDLGAGLRYALSPRLQLSGDVRIGRQEEDQTDVQAGVAFRAGDSDDRYTRARLSLSVLF